MPLSIYRSSAGSGKTFTLVKEYLKLIFRSTSNYKRILAITFTNKASQEMKERILRDLHLLAVGQNKELLEQILQELASENFTLEADEVPGIARTALQRILHDYGNFSVSTIDSFFQRIVRSFSKELKLPMRYEIQLDAGIALDEVIARIMEKINKSSDQALSRWMEHFAFESIDDDKGWNIERAMRSLGSELFKENINQLIELDIAQRRKIDFDSLQEYIVIFKSLRSSFVQKLSDWAQQADQIISSSEYEWKHFISGVNSFFPKLLELKYDYGLRVSSAYEDPAKWVTLKNPLRDQLISFVEQNLQHLLVQSVDYIEEYIDIYNSSKAVLQQIHTYGLLLRMKQELSIMRKDNNHLLISDTTPLLRDLVHEQDAPFIFEKVGTQFYHMMIDEFQDTSGYQWASVKPLVNNVLASPHNHALFVGDVKQSIYRWRGGDMRLLLEKLNEDLSQHSTSDSEKVLNTNYRSDWNIVAFNNAFFDLAPELLGNRIEGIDGSDLELCYENAAQQISRPSNTGYVQLDFLAKPDKDDPAGPGQNYDHIVRTIREAQLDGYELGEIAIIVRKNAWGIEIADYLKKHGIPVISSQSLLLKHSIEVRLVVNIFRFLQDGQNRIAQGGIVQHAKLINDLQTGGAKNDDYQDLSRSYDKQSNFQMTYPFLFGGERNRLLRKPLYEMTEIIIRKLGLSAKLDIYLQTFLDVLQQSASAMAKDLNEFLDWWDDQENSDKQFIKSPDASHAVRVTTVHKSKGLEFPVVIVPNAYWNIYPSNFTPTILWASTDYQHFNDLNPFPVKYASALAKSAYAKDYENEKLLFNLDLLNELYVSFTRARNRLYVFSRKPSGKPRDEIKNAAQLIQAVLSEFSFKIAYDQNAGRLSLGQKAKRPQKQETKANRQLKFTEPANYESKLRIKQQSDDFFLLTEDTSSTAIRRGTKIHRIFELLDHPRNLRTAINRVHSEGLLLDAEVEVLFQEIQEILKIERVKDWFEGSWEVLNERELYKANELLRPDRVMLDGLNATVVDYKTGQRDDKKYKKQLDQYAELLQEMGYQVEKYLFYVDQSLVAAV